MDVDDTLVYNSSIEGVSRGGKDDPIVFDSSSDAPIKSDGDDIVMADCDASTSSEDARKGMDDGDDGGLGPATTAHSTGAPVPDATPAAVPVPPSAPALNENTDWDDDLDDEGFDQALAEHFAKADQSPLLLPRASNPLSNATVVPSVPQPERAVVASSKTDWDADIEDDDDDELDAEKLASIAEAENLPPNQRATKPPPSIPLQTAPSKPPRPSQNVFSRPTRPKLISQVTKPCRPNTSPLVVTTSSSPPSRNDQLPAPSSRSSAGPSKKQPCASTSRDALGARSAPAPLPTLPPLPPQPPAPAYPSYADEDDSDSDDEDEDPYLAAKASFFMTDEVANRLELRRLRKELLDRSASFTEVIALECLFRRHPMIAPDIIARLEEHEPTKRAIEDAMRHPETFKWEDRPDAFRLSVVNGFAASSKNPADRTSKAYLRVHSQSLADDLVSWRALMERYPAEAAACAPRLADPELLAAEGVQTKSTALYVGIMIRGNINKGHAPKGGDEGCIKVRSQDRLSEYPSIPTCT